MPAEQERFVRRGRQRVRSWVAVGAAVCALVLSGCAGSASEDGDSGEGGAGGDVLTVYATTGYLADAVANIAPEAEVTTMVGPGGDPHTHQPSTRDIEAILDADVVLWNGLQLEAHMLDQLASLGDRQLAVAEQLPAHLLLEWETGHDPHVWNSPVAWSAAVDIVADKLAAVDPANATVYAANAAAYRAEIERAAATAETMLAGVPEPRILITGHDAFNYFGATYDFTVYATDFVSSDAALSPAELSGLATLIADNRVPVIFLDNQVNPQAITSLQEAVRALGWRVEIADGELYADSLGAEPGVDTYLGVFSHNARVIADALGGGT